MNSYQASHQFCPEPRKRIAVFHSAGFTRGRIGGSILAITMNTLDKHEHHVRDVLIRVIGRLFEPQPKPKSKKTKGAIK